MKTYVLLSSMVLATATLILPAKAETNILRKVSIELTVQSQRPSVTNKDGTITETIMSSALTSAGSIKALGTDTNLTSSAFSSKAYLAFDTVVTNGTNLPPILVVVEGSGTNMTLTPVGSNITFAALGPALHDATIRTNGTENGTTYRIRRLDINITNQWTLNLRGLAVRNVLDIIQGKGSSAIHVDAGDTLWNLSGYGKEGTNSTPVIVTGTLFAQYSSVAD